MIRNKTKRKKKTQNNEGGGGEHPQLTMQLHIDGWSRSPPPGVHTAVMKLRPYEAAHLHSHPSSMQRPIVLVHLHFLFASSPAPALLLLTATLLQYILHREHRT